MLPLTRVYGKISGSSTFMSATLPPAQRCAICRWKIWTEQPRNVNVRETGKPNVSTAPRAWK